MTFWSDHRGIIYGVRTIRTDVRSNLDPEGLTLLCICVEIDKLLKNQNNYFQQNPRSLDRHICAGSADTD